MARLNPRLQLIVLCVVVLFALYSNLRIINKEVDRLRFHPEERMEEENRERSLGELKRLLPRSGVVGYISDQASATGRKIYNFFLTEYALCPLILVRGAKTPFVIVDCEKSMASVCFSDADYALIKTLDNGVKLYRQKQK